MNVFDKFFKKFSYKFPKGYPDIENPNDVKLMEEIFHGMGIDINIKEEKASSIRKGDTFTLSDDIGNFKKGETVTVDDVLSFGNDIEIHLSNENNEKDVFHIDRDDTFDELSEIILEEE
jgi:hypothetical protein